MAAAPVPFLSDSSPRLGVEGLAFADLFTVDGLERLDAAFLERLRVDDPEAAALLVGWRARPDEADEAVTSERVLRLAPHVGAFIARLFGIEVEASRLAESVRAEEPLFVFRKHFVKRRLAKPSNPPVESEAARRIAEAAWAALGEEGADEERSVALATLRLQEALDVVRKARRGGGATLTEELAERIATLDAALGLEPVGDDLERAEARLTETLDAIEGRLRSRLADPLDPAQVWSSLRLPKTRDFARLVPLRTPRGAMPGEHGRHGEGRTRAEPFALTDDRGGQRRASSEIAHCLDCHERQKDSCRRGLRDKAGAVKKNPLGVEASGCPLGEKIGEMQSLRRAGELIAALATVTIDNPMCPGTGHRICNDCMKGCVFQTQDPVDIPRVETRVLDEVLSLPYGFEIWSLLTRWSPLDPRRPVPRRMHGKKVLVVGLGPAGYTLAHYLLREGFCVVAIDGLKIEPLPPELIGGDGQPPPAIRDAAALFEPLERRRVLGFGGVSEYGITVRWDKSFLTLLYLNLLRRPGFRAYDGIRFGGTVTLDDAWALGFDHVAMAAGAGRPTIIPVPNGLARGVRQASDFLMALQLGGAFRRDALAALQLRLPAIVIGSGLTAIDTATEALAYYVHQVEQTSARYARLVAERGEASLRALFDEEELGILDEALAHGRELALECESAAREGRAANFQPLLDRWGGVRVVYRRRLVDSPAYRLNHEEVEHSLEEGVRYVELASPEAVEVDRFGAVEAVRFVRQRPREGGGIEPTEERLRLPARSVFVAAGTSPNVSYERERPGSFTLDARGYFATHRAERGDDGALRLVPGEGFFTDHRSGDRLVSFYGDNHPRYAGSVVKAMASAKDGHLDVVALFEGSLEVEAAEAARRQASFAAFASDLDDLWRPRVHSVERLAPGIVEVVVHAPAAARAFEPGQFYRLQSYEAYSRELEGTPLSTEGLALTGASTDPERGLLSMIVLEMGASSRLSAELSPGDRVVVMGPTGTPTEIAADETVLLVGGGLGNAVLFSIAKAFRALGSRVLYFAGYRQSEQLFAREEIETSTDQVIWATDSGPPIEPARPQDRHFRGNIVEAMVAFGEGRLGEVEVSLDAIDRVIAIGSDGMMRAVAGARHGALARWLPPTHRAIGSINSPMQCMMKEICAQCLQRHVDPETGEERYVYSCVEQDQPLDAVDFDHLRQRLRQASVQEKLADLWLAHLKDGPAGPGSRRLPMVGADAGAAGFEA